MFALDAIHCTTIFFYGKQTLIFFHLDIWFVAAYIFMPDICIIITNLCIIILKHMCGFLTKVKLVVIFVVKVIDF